MCLFNVFHTCIQQGSCDFTIPERNKNRHGFSLNAFCICQNVDYVKLQLEESPKEFRLPSTIAKKQHIVTKQVLITLLQCKHKQTNPNFMFQLHTLTFQFSAQTEFEFDVFPFGVLVISVKPACHFKKYTCKTGTNRYQDTCKDM